VNRRLAVSLLLMSGCSPIQTIDSDFSGLKGQPISSVVARLGPPESRQGTASVWTERVRDDTPVHTQKTIFANGQATTIDVMARPDPPLRRTCTLTLQADDAGTIVAVERDGSSAACAPMARKVAG
jgi:hypothetical protein